MLKTRGRKRHTRATHKKCVNCTAWKQRRKGTKRSKRNKRRTHKKRMRGGRSDEPTIDTIDGIPVTEDADVSIPGYGTISAKDFKRYKEDMDFQGTGGNPGYD